MGATQSNSPRGNIREYMDMLITSSSRTQSRMSRNMLLIGKTSSRKLYSYVWGDELMKGSLLNMGFSLYTRKHSMRSWEKSKVQGISDPFWPRWGS